MVKKLGYSVLVAGALTFGTVITAFIDSATAQHYQILQPDGKDVVKEEEKKETKEIRAEEEKEEMCQKCKHLPSNPEGDCRCDCHHRHK